MARIKICKEAGCKDAATTEGYCRLHYLRNWKSIKQRKQRRRAKKLEGYIRSVMRRHPKDYVEVIKRDIRSPDFERRAEEGLGQEEDTDLFNNSEYDEEIDELIRKLKIEKGF
jgi:hypothetical protein